MIPEIFDSRLLRLRLERAHAAGYAGFLMERAAAELEDRVETVLRTFERALDVGSPSGHGVQRLGSSGKIREIVRLSPVSDPGAAAVVDETSFPPEGLGQFDLAFSLLALHAVNDLPGVLSRLVRLLKPDGLFIGSLFGNDTLSELRQAFLIAESELDGGGSPRIAPFADIRAAGDLMQRAGFALSVSDHDEVSVRYPDVFHLMTDLRAMGGGNALIGRSRKPLRRTTLMRMAQVYAERFSDADGRIRATFDIIWLIGWAPDPSQPKPLRPGQFTVRMEDAVKSANSKP
ncbi:MAG: class I SAM-dependent methyltransferase [Methylobacteriaceae bacterium]|jgi:SAM-dependent methyltransferase|nr:class I SAM-dependent methyltransferase [Methylobacteriaceae bacterium]